MGTQGRGGKASTKARKVSKSSSPGRLGQGDSRERKQLLQRPRGTQPRVSLENGRWVSIAGAVMAERLGKPGKPFHKR